MLDQRVMLQPHPDGAYRLTAGRLVAIPQAQPGRSPVLVTLNDTGTLIWRQIESRATLRDLLAQLRAWYPAVPPQGLEQEVLIFVEQLLAAGVASAARPVDA